MKYVCHHKYRVSFFDVDVLVHYHQGINRSLLTNTWLNLHKFPVINAWTELNTDY